MCVLAHPVQTALIGLQRLIQGGVLSHGESADLILLYNRVIVSAALFFTLVEKEKSELLCSFKLLTSSFL